METFTQACSHEEESELMQNIFEDESLMLESYGESTDDDYNLNVSVAVLDA